MTEVHTHISGLARRTAFARADMPGVTVHGRHDLQTCSGVVAFTHDTIHAEDLAHLMDAGGFAIRTGHHCAQPVMDFFEIPAAVRASFALYNTREEIDRLVKALQKALVLFCS